MDLSVSLLDYLWAFLGGVLVSLTPCVYPLIPVTASFIGVNSAGSKARGLLLGLIYVTGLALTYSLLGLLASLSGKLFGSFSSLPWVRVTSGAVIIFFGLAMLDLFSLSLPGIIRQNTLKKHNKLSTFILGLTSGLVISPCLTPVLGTILTYLAAKKNIFYGTTLLFVFAFGTGSILILIGLSSNILLSLPQSGKWMGYIKKAGGLIMVFTGIYVIFTGIQRF